MARHSRAWNGIPWISRAALVLGAAVIGACSSPLDTPSDDGDVSSAELEASEGEIGLVVDVRQIARRGYEPENVAVSFAGELSAYDASVEVDPDTTVATLSIPIETLTAQQIETFAGGVDVSITVTDPTGTTLATYAGSERVDSSNQPLMVSTQLEGVYPDMALAPDVPYAIQIVDTDAELDRLLLRSAGSPQPSLAEPIIGFEQTDTDNLQTPPNDELYRFYFEPSPDGYYIKMQYQSNDAVYLTVSTPDGTSGYPANTLNASGVTTLPDNPEAYEFELEWDSEGFARVIGPAGRPIDATIIVSGSGPGAFEEVVLVESSSVGSYVPLRIVATNVQWTITDEGTTYSPPVTPPAQLEFAYRSVLRNCSSASLEETVGRSQTETVTITTSTQESLELYSSQEESLEVSASVEVGGAFKALSASASLSTTQSFTYTTSTTESTSNTWTSSESTTEEVSRVRTVGLEPFTVVEVYDAIASFNSVSMPFVNVLRVRGRYDGSDPLTGSQIVSQLLGNRFGGVIATVGTDFVDISIRGNAIINNFYEVESGVVEIEDACEDE